MHGPMNVKQKILIFFYYLCHFWRQPVGNKQVANTYTSAPSQRRRKYPQVADICHIPRTQSWKSDLSQKQIFALNKIMSESFSFRFMVPYIVVITLNKNSNCMYFVLKIL